MMYKTEMSSVRCSFLVCCDVFDYDSNPSTVSLF